jgi:glucosamine 6-phosphate synthetase-like amidotransferase/phosphosugar isomerase protein
VRNCWIYSTEKLTYCNKGVKGLEYRGYDSAGVMIYDGDDILLCKTKGKVVDLEENFKRNDK